MRFQADYFTLNSVEVFPLVNAQVLTGPFSLITKSIDQALSDAKKLTGLDLIQFSSEFFVLGNLHSRLVVGVAE